VTGDTCEGTVGARLLLLTDRRGDKLDNTDTFVITFGLDAKKMSLKVTGTNFMTAEMRLQKNCVDDGSCPNCWCNTEIWQTPPGTVLPPYSGAINNSEATRGGGYTEARMYASVQKIENRIL